MKHDFDGQKRETFETFDELKKLGETLPDLSILEVYLLAEGADANWGAAEKALSAQGFKTERDREGETLIVATKSAIRMTPDAIWEVERQISEIGLKFDFVPDGWEFGFD
ncbi:ribonuclease E inhibitor RraB [Pseudotabrizicola sp. L79]|uniref:ribonuclease E inhibitor RraB n=1 Tax=Pseudotabrizicola sp. L79 TaxID=3118402 RepID=UPI002F9255B2